ncbi:hypothetical protein [Methylomonas sp. AM2-LC]|uniref:hypothetical protein n=1 Tax=Methylomonas sp. AM2-LC TaxID=3153301 RepID=UPI0032643741
MFKIAKTMSWYRITLSRQEYESGEMAIFFGAFRAAYISRNGPKGMAMFGGWADDNACYFVYTTPRSVRHIAPILDAYSAKQIEMPNNARLSWIYGDESDFTSFDIGIEA